MKIKNELIDWYRANKRDLPWRKSQDPYSVMISEIMLQQTTVSVVIPYFERFLREFPNVLALANARQEKVLSLWSGLGYYSRARNLHTAAQEIAKREDGFPKTYEDLLELKGIGPYTAAAIASIAFGVEVAAIDGNVIRVVSRLFDVLLDVGTTLGRAEITRHATKLILKKTPSEHNQAMMELGATICIPKNPLCLLCPVMKFCESFKNKTMNERPVKAKKRRQEPWLWTMYYLTKEGQIALVKEENGTPWLKNTWVLPGSARPWSEKKPPASDFRHSITHHKIFVKIEKVTESLNANHKKVKWVKMENISKLGVSSVVQKALKIAPLLSLFSLASALFLGPGCKTSSVNPESQSSNVQGPLKRGIITDKIEQLTFDGENSNPALSPDGFNLMFQSKNRPAHSNSQIYLLNLRNHRERRLTYNDGNDSSPTFSPSGKKIIYSSTTDELKENLQDKAQAASQNSESFPNYEIYQADASGSHRERLTHSVGYDSDAVYAPDGRKILFTSRRHGPTELFVMDVSGLSQRHLLTTDPKKEKDSPNRQSVRLSPNGKMVTWSEEVKPDVSQIFLNDLVSKKVMQLTQKSALHQNPSWMMNGLKIIFSSNRNAVSGGFELYMINFDGTCIKRLTQSEENETQPLLSSDGKSLIYTSDRSGKSQIYKMIFAEPAECLDEKP